MNGIVVTVGRNIEARRETISRFAQTIALQEHKPMYVCVVVCGTRADAQAVEDEMIGHLTYHKLNVLFVEDRPGPYPEAMLKNIGVRYLSQEGAEKICCTNIDIVFHPLFFKTVFKNTGDMVLVQALRLNTLEGAPPVGLDSTCAPPVSAVVDGETRCGVAVMACGDCQCLTSNMWDALGGYDERMVGWGTLDVDLQCRALMKGCTLLVFSPLVARHVHVWHPTASKDDHTAEAAYPYSLALQNMKANRIRPSGDRWGNGATVFRLCEDNAFSPRLNPLNTDGTQTVSVVCNAEANVAVAAPEKNPEEKPEPKLEVTPEAKKEEEKPFRRAYRCRRCGKDLDCSANPKPKIACEYCGSGQWEEVRVLTLDEAFTLYADHGVVFLNEDNPVHVAFKERVVLRSEEIDDALKTGTDGRDKAKQIWDAVADEARKAVEDNTFFSEEKPGDQK